MPRNLALQSKHKLKQNFLKRCYSMLLIIILFLVILLARLIDLQIIHQSVFNTLSKKNQLALKPIAPNRGLIFDRNGTLLAENIPVFNLEIILSKVNNLAATIAQLKTIIAISDEDLEQFHKSLKQHHPFESIPLRFKLTPTEVARFEVNRYRFSGVHVQASLIRHYPLGKEFAHILGYVGRINDTDLQYLEATNYSASHFIGKVGIEKYHESTLHGKVGYAQVETDASGRIVRTLSRTLPTSGATIYLTIDSGLQHAADQALGNNQGAVVAIDPNNGEVLALVSHPNYEPNLFIQGMSYQKFSQLQSSKDQPLYNRAIRGQYPIASTIKPFLALKALDDEDVSTHYSIYDPGWYKLPNSDHRYHDWKRTGHGWINLTRAIIVSCDTYFYNLAHILGIKSMDNILKQFGFGSYTHIDMGEELPGLVPTPSWKVQHKGEHWYPGDTVNAGIGQGYLLTTPIQLAQATATLAMHGQHYQAHILYKIKTSDGHTFTQQAKLLRPVKLHHPKNWNIVLTAMHEVITSKEGTGFRFGRDTPYTAAIKTGTAQVFSADKRRVQQTILPKNLRDHSLFIGFAPVDKPKIVLAIVVENNSIASKVARSIMDYYLLPKTSNKHDV